MSDPLPSSEQEKQEQVAQPEETGLSEDEQLRADAEARIEAEAKALAEEPGEAPAEPEKSTEPPPQEPKPQPEPEKPPVESPPVDYKRDYGESTREAQIILERNKQLETRIATLTTNNPPTDDELKSAYPDWEQRDEKDKHMLREQLAIKKQSAQTRNMLLDMLEEQHWNADYARTLTSNPALAGRETEFKAYCYKPTHKNVPIDVLVKSFLFDVKRDAPPAPSAPLPGLEPGSGGPKDSAIPGKISVEEAALIRANDPKRYRQLVKAGKIDDGL